MEFGKIIYTNLHRITQIYTNQAKLQGFCLYLICTYWNYHFHILVEVLREHVCSEHIRIWRSQTQAISLAAADPLGVADTKKETRKTILSFYPYKIVLGKDKMYCSKSQKTGVRGEANALSALFSEGESSNSQEIEYDR